MASFLAAALAGEFPDLVRRGVLSDIVLVAAAVTALGVLWGKGVKPAFRAVRRVWKGLAEMVDTWNAFKGHDASIDKLTAEVESLRRENREDHSLTRTQFREVRETLDSMAAAIEGMKDEVALHDVSDRENFAAIREWSKQFREFDPIEVPGS